MKKKKMEKKKKRPGELGVSTADTRQIGVGSMRTEGVRTIGGREAREWACIECPFACTATSLPSQ